MTPHKAQGYIALSLLLIVVVGVSTFALSSFNNVTRPPAEVVKRQQAMAELEQAKVELLAYVSNTHRIHGDRGPGYFPVPDPGDGTPSNAMRGLLPTEIKGRDESILYRFAPHGAGRIQYEVDPALVYTPNSTADQRTSTAATRLELNGTQNIAALLTYPGSDTFDDILLPIHHEEVMNAIAPTVAPYIGQVLKAYRERRNRFPTAPAVLLPPRDLNTDIEDNEHRVNTGRSQSNDNRRRDRQDDFPWGGGKPPSPILDLSNAAPSWLFDEGWLNNLAGYEQSRRTDSISFVVGGCLGMVFSLQYPDGSLTKSGNRCGN